MRSNSPSHDPDASSVERDRTNLGRERTTFYGRRAELETLRGFLQKGQRLITICGPPGIGKTRLARRFAETAMTEFSEGFPGGFWFVDLSETQHLDDLIEATSRVLDIQLSTVGETEQARHHVAWAIAGQGPFLVLFDHFEHLAKTCSDTLVEWLDRSDKGFFLVTSRQPLDLPGQVRIDLGPLETPFVGLTDAQELMRFDAVGLMLDRIRTNRPAFEPDYSDLQGMAQMVRQLNGLPLAIELVAGHMALSGPGKLIDQLNQAYERLAGMNVGLSAGQLNLKATLDWTWSLLKPWERMALSQLTVFRGGFDLESADGVLDLRSAQGAPSMIDVLRSLQSKFLLTVKDEDAPGGMRFRLHPSVASYASEQLAEKREWREIVQRHAAHFAECGHLWVRRVALKGRTTELRRLSRDRENFRALLERALTPSLYNRPGAFQTTYEAVESAYVPEVRRRPLTLATDWVLSTLLALYPEYQAQSSFHLYLSWIKRVFMAIELSKPGSPGLVSEVLIARARILRFLNQHSESLGFLRQALSLAESVKDAKLVAMALIDMGKVYTKLRQWEDAFGSCRDALEACDRAQEPVLNARAIHLRGAIHHQREQYTQARKYYQSAVRILNRWGARRETGRILINLGRVHAAFCDVELAEAKHLEALDICSELGDRGMEAIALVSLGETYTDFGQLDRALSVFQEALTLCWEIGNFHSVSRIHTTLGFILLNRGELALARQHTEHARTIQREMGTDKLSRAKEFTLLGLIEWEQERLETALEHVSQAVVLARECQSPSLEALYLGIRGALEAELHRTSDAQSTFQAVEFILENTPYTWVSQAVSLYQGFLDLTLARLAEGQRDAGAAVRHRTRALERLVQIVRRRCLPDAEERAKPDRALLNIDSTYAARRLERALPMGDRLQLRVDALDPKGQALVIDTECSWFRPPGGSWVEVGERSKLRPLLNVLVRRREAGLGPISPADLVGEAWPHEVMDRASAMDRIRWALDTLQEFGLHETLITAQGHYTLDPNLMLIVVSQEVLDWAYPFETPETAVSSRQ